VDTNTAIIIGVVIVAIAVVVIGLKSNRLSVVLKTVFGKLFLRASNDPPAAQAAIKGQDLTSREGGVTAADATGRGVDLQRVEAKKDIKITAVTPEGAAPKKA